MNPMDTAPRDGTRIIVTKKLNPHRPFRKHNRFYARWNADGFWALSRMESDGGADWAHDRHLEGWEPCP